MCDKPKYCPTCGHPIAYPAYPTAPCQGCPFNNAGQKK